MSNIADLANLEILSNTVYPRYDEQLPCVPINVVDTALGSNEMELGV